MVVLAPHPDDETLACTGTILKKIQEGYDVHVVVMTGGHHSHDLVLGLKRPSPERIARTRATELREATKILGVNPSNLILLAFEDGKLMQHTTKTKKRISQILRKIRPCEIYVPYRRDCNEDHRATYDIFEASIREADFPYRIYEYPVWNKKIHQLS